MTRRLHKLCAALLGAAVLIGCDEIDPSGRMSLLGRSAGAEASVLTSAGLAGGAIHVSGPDGYCVDPDSLRRTATGGFAAIASCNILSGGAQGPVVEPALATVTVSQADASAPTPPDLAAALQTELLTTREFDAVTVGQMASGGAEAFVGSDPRHWRGAFLVGPYLVGVTLYAPRNSPLVSTQGAAFLNTVSSRIRARFVPAAGESAEQSQSPENELKAGLGRLFERRDLQQ